MGRVDEQALRGHLYAASLQRQRAAMFQACTRAVWIRRPAARPLQAVGGRRQQNKGRDCSESKPYRDKAQFNSLTTRDLLGVPYH